MLQETDDFSAVQLVVLASQRLVLLEESSPCLPFRQADWRFLLILPAPSCQTLLRTTEVSDPGP